MHSAVWKGKNGEPGALNLRNTHIGNLADAQDAGTISVQLDAVTFIDPAGKALLRTMHERGAVLAASGCMTRAILEEIRAAG